MLFSSLVFLWYFLPIVFLLYFITKNRYIRNGVLLAASILFYAWGEPKYVFLMLFSITANYLFGLLISAAGSRRRRQTALTLCILVNLGLLGYFKYFNFLIDTADYALLALTGGRWQIQPKNIALPIGISFYTFQALSYVVDVYRKDIKVQKNLFHLALYISFFPQLIAGPIVKYHDVCTQIESRTCTLEKNAYGIKRFTYGLAKKMLLANTFAASVDTIMGMPPEHLGTVSIWLMTLLYSLQIYFDFSGYSDMAIGLGKMFGFDFMENFNYPFLSSSIKEFWRRWHISLSTWFREYLYIPLGGSRKGKTRTYLNLLIVFFATGLWHGAGANFVIWGLYYGGFLILERVWLGQVLEKNPIKILNHIYAMLVVMIGWVLFRAENIADAMLMYRRMFTWHGEIYPLQLFAGNKVIFLAVCGILGCGILQSIFPRMKARLYNEKEITVADILIMAALLFLCTMYLVNNTYNPFIYFRF